MTTAVVTRKRVRREAPANRVWDRVFFACMIVFAFATAIIGFWPTYYGAGVMHAPLPSRVVHVHGAVFTLWMVLLVVQSALISAKRVRWHRTLGIAGFGLAAVMVVLGLWAAVDALRRGVAPGGFDGRTFLIIPFSDVLVFAVLIVCAYATRFKPVLHKRYILFATVILLDAALGRAPYADHPVAMFGTIAVLLLAPIAYDVVSLRRVPVATWASVLLIVVVTTFRLDVGRTATWLKFGSWLKG